MKSSNKIGENCWGWWSYCGKNEGYCFHGRVCIYKYRNLILFDQKVGKNKIGMLIPVKVYLMGCQGDSHMTNYQKWPK